MGIGPVVRRAGVIGLFRADEGARLDPGDVSWVEAGPEAVRTLRFGEAVEGPLLDEKRAEPLVLLAAAVAPLDALGSGERGEVLDKAA